MTTTVAQSRQRGLEKASRSIVRVLDEVKIGGGWARRTLFEGRVYPMWRISDALAWLDSKGVVERRVVAGDEHWRLRPGMGVAEVRERQKIEKQFARAQAKAERVRQEAEARREIERNVERLDAALTDIAG